MSWYEEKGMSDNPFEDAPEKFAGKMVGRDALLDELSYRVQAGSMAFIEGPPGSGKTLLLRALIHRFRGRKRVIYVDAKTLGEPNIEDFMQRRYGMAGKLFNIIPRHMILMVDNVGVLSKQNAQRLQYFFDNGHIDSVVFTAESFARSPLPKSIRDRIGGRIVRLRPLSDEDAVAMVRARTAPTELIAEKEIKQLFAKSLNVRDFLQKCEEYVNG